jgi:hypothetical protein
MTKTITTPNILEISYLLDRHHQIIDVATQAGWPYGIEELAVTLEGENIDLDHANFIRHGESIKLTSLPVVFDSIMIQVWRKVRDGSIDMPAQGGRS